MADMQNHQFVEACFPMLAGFVPATQLDSSPGAGYWIDTKDYYKVTGLIITTGGTTADDLVITVNQATSNGGAGSKVCASVIGWGMYQASTISQSSTGTYAFTKLTTPPGSSFTATGSAGKQSIIVFDIDCSYLDATNGFDFVNYAITQTADSALGTALYLPFTRHPQGGVAYPINPLS